MLCSHCNFVLLDDFEMTCAEEQPHGDNELPKRFHHSDTCLLQVPEKAFQSCSASHCDVPLLVNGFCHPRISLPGLILHDESSTSSILSLRTESLTNFPKKRRHTLPSSGPRHTLFSALKGGRKLLRRLSLIFPSPEIDRTKRMRKLAEAARHDEDDYFINQYARRKLNEYQRVYDKLTTSEQFGPDIVNEDYRVHQAPLLTGARSKLKERTNLEEELLSLEPYEDDEVFNWNSRIWNRLTFDGFTSVGTIAALLWPAWTEASENDKSQESEPFDDLPNWNAKGWHQVVRGSMMWSFAAPMPGYALKWAIAGGDYQAQWLL